MGLMEREMRYMHNWGEVAPALVIPHEKPSNNVSKLETIAEEGSECQSFEILPKRVVFLFPVFLSLMTYFIFCRQIA
ncbi:endoplasmic reticulum oxidoreductin-1-like [Pyrus ussuriensis x Pyrus communis]|uniref:Endoplasmic reticulum oxidoreductin-1-like n=1 Tax=Pyrus ussuriensis x Pyrus communis TaxID=2448454 RepID=A0A5N5FF64_9ROSA|nr:endoplasmic reticulum oxidoreductin-1-like [Pyrus ussuriensis x Pyrus communis]